MTSLFRSSGDPLADKRYAYAADLLAEGEAAAAADLLAQTLERVPGWAVAWLALGEAEERRSYHGAALTAYQKAARLDASGELGAALRIARLTGATPATAPAAHVAALFDDYAGHFDRHLTETLDYRGPALLVAGLDAAHGTRSYAETLDLGCGTGLMGAALGGRVLALDGLDLSAAMLAQAAARGLYRSLAQAELGAALAACPAARCDLILAADVLVYVGDLAPVFREVARVLRPGGALAFTVQALARDGYRLGPDLRFAHAATYVAAALGAAGLVLASLEPQSTRQDGGVPVPGLVVVAGRD